jgi:hypothetical protein
VATLVRNLLNDQPAGTTPATTDPGAPTQFSAVTLTGGTLTRSTTPGTSILPMWLQVAVTSNAACHVAMAIPATNKAAVHAYIYDTAYNQNRVVALATATPTTYVDIVKSGTGTLQLVNNAGTTLWTSSGTYSLNTAYRVECTHDNTGGSSAGIFTVNTYLVGSNTPIATLSVSLTAQATGASQVTQAFFGRYQGTSTTGTYYLGDLAAQSTNVEIGEYQPLVSPLILPPTPRQSRIWVPVSFPGPRLVSFPTLDSTLAVPVTVSLLPTSALSFSAGSSATVNGQQQTSVIGTPALTVTAPATATFTTQLAASVTPTAAPTILGATTTALTAQQQATPTPTAALSLVPSTTTTVAGQSAAALTTIGALTYARASTATVIGQQSATLVTNTGLTFVGAPTATVTTASGATSVSLVPTASLTFSAAAASTVNAQIASTLAPTSALAIAPPTSATMAGQKAASLVPTTSLAISIPQPGTVTAQRAATFAPIAALTFTVTPPAAVVAQLAATVASTTRLLFAGVTTVTVTATTALAGDVEFTFHEVTNWRTSEQGGWAAKERAPAWVTAERPSGWTAKEVNGEWTTAEALRT